MSRVAWIGSLFVLCASMSCDAESGPSRIVEGTLLAEPLADFPEHLSDIGLYQRLPSLEVPHGVHDYAPIWPLWTNGSEKHRHVFVPSAVNVSDANAWNAPAGTIFFKTFAYVRADGSRQLVETRVLRRNENGWDYASYQWNDAGDDAVKLDLRTSTPVPVQDASGESFMHRIPNRTECRSCHESGPTPLLGFSATQLDDSALDALFAHGVLSARPASVDRVTSADAQTQEVLGYFQGNCVHCHNGDSHAQSTLNLRHGVAIENIVGVRTQSSATASGLRVAPGDPASSILFLAVSGESDNAEIKAMPPVGVDRRDMQSIARLRSWIEDLPHE